MRRFALLLAGGALWLFLAAIPTLADGGPHAMAQNSGSSTLTADGCAACHRAHTATGESLLNNPAANTSIDSYCVTCHGAAGTGATTDVTTGVQYNGTGGTRGTVQLGALRGGGFELARINSGNASRSAYWNSGRSETSFVAKVGVTDPTAVTSAHVVLPGVTGLEPQLMAWGNGASTNGAGTSMPEMQCTSCHNPHGNGQYRILRPVPHDIAAASVTIPAATTSVADDDANRAAVVSPGTDARNYTVIQYDPVNSTATAPSRYLLASQVEAAESGASPLFDNKAGDYFHKSVPWTSTAGSSNFTFADQPNGQSSYTNQMTAWCVQCHSRYTGGSDPTDPIFTHRHVTNNNRACTTCHVAHGSNAAMPGTRSGNYPYPNSTTSAPNLSNSSRLLKVDNRGTCQLCHEPTESVLAQAGNTSPGSPTNPLNPYLNWPTPVTP